MLHHFFDIFPCSRKVRRQRKDGHKICLYANHRSPGIELPNFKASSPDTQTEEFYLQRFAAVVIKLASRH